MDPEVFSKSYCHCKKGQFSIFWLINKFQQILRTFSGEVGHGTKEKLCGFSGDLITDTDPGLFQGFVNIGRKVVFYIFVNNSAGLDKL